MLGDWILRSGHIGYEKIPQKVIVARLVAVAFVARQNRQHLDGQRPLEIAKLDVLLIWVSGPSSGSKRRLEAELFGGCRLPASIAKWGPPGKTVAERFEFGLDLYTVHLARPSSRLQN